MSEHRPIYKKGSLLYATIVALACVMTASVSTFAWFQAEANVRVSTTNSSTTITVSAPESRELGAATMYAYNDNGSYGYTGDIKTGSRITDGDVLNFTEVTSVNKASLLAVTNLSPGKKMSFGVKIETDSALTSASLALVKYTAKNNTYRKVLTSLSNPGSENGSTGTIGDIVFIEDIVNLYGSANGTGSFSLGSAKNMSADFSCSKTYTAGSGYTTKAFDNLDYGIFNDVSVSVAASAYLYVFYTIELSSSAGLYNEYVKSGEKYYPCHEVISSDLTDNRYFYQPASGGNSTGYAKLQFQVNELKVSAN